MCITENNYKKTILIVAAHPDDEILGCGGTIARLIRDGFKAYSLILGEGITSRNDLNTQNGHLDQEIELLRKQSQKANKRLGITEVIFKSFPDNRFDTIALLDIVKTIEKVKRQLSPSIIFTHFKEDLNIDHRITYDAVITATRPLSEEIVREIYSFEVQSSTEWNWPLTFSPDIYFDISETLNIKKEALKEYSKEIRELPHPRSIEGTEINACYWGLRTGVRYAEAFKVVRIIR